MKKIITALGNNILNESLKENEKYLVYGNDIQYKEGILEILNQTKDIDILIISEILDGEIEFKKLISEILKLKSDIDIIVFLEDNNKEIKNFLYENGIYKVYINNQLGINELISVLDNESTIDAEILSQEIRRLKQIIEEQNENLKVDEKNGEIIAIIGCYGVGKSTISCILCKEFSNQKKKTLIIDFDIYNKSISVLYNFFNKNVDYQNLRNNIIKVSEYENLLYIETNHVDSLNIFTEIKNLKKEYDQIIIDTSSNIESNYYKNILEISDSISFIVVPTICDLKKSINFFEIIKDDFGIDINRIKLLINKENNYSVDSLIIKKIFGIEKIWRYNKVF